MTYNFSVLVFLKNILTEIQNMKSLLQSLTFNCGKKTHNGILLSHKKKEILPFVIALMDLQLYAK